MNEGFLPYNFLSFANELFESKIFLSQIVILLESKEFPFKILNCVFSFIVPGCWEPRWRSTS